MLRGQVEAKMKPHLLASVERVLAEIFVLFCFLQIEFDLCGENCLPEEAHKKRRVTHLPE